MLVPAGRPNEATRYVATAEAMSGPEDVEAQALWRGAKARQLGVTNRVDEAITLATEAVELLRSTEARCSWRTRSSDLGEVLRAAGRVTDAELPLREAMGLYAAKGSVGAAERPRRVLARPQRTRRLPSSDAVAAYRQPRMDPFVGVQICVSSCRRGSP